MRREGVGHAAHARGVGMDPVRQDLGGMQRHPLHQKGHEGGAGRSGDLGIDGVEGPGIGAEPGRRAHAADKDGDAAAFEPVDDGQEMGPHAVGGDQLHHVVGAQGQDAEVGLDRHVAIDPPQTVGGGVAGDAGADDPDWRRGVFKAFGQLTREALGRFQAVASGQGVAQEGDDAFRSRAVGARAQRKTRIGPVTRAGSARWGGKGMAVSFPGIRRRARLSFREGRGVWTKRPWRRRLRPGTDARDERP